VAGRFRDKARQTPGRPERAGTRRSHAGPRAAGCEVARYTVKSPEAKLAFDLPHH